MKTQNMEFTKAEQVAEEMAKKESPFTCGDLAEEIVPLLSDYFSENFRCNGNRVLCSFLNGQRFVLSVERFPA